MSKKQTKTISNPLVNMSADIWLFSYSLILFEDNNIQLSSEASSRVDMAVWKYWNETWRQNCCKTYHHTLRYWSFLLFIIYFWLSLEVQKTAAMFFILFLLINLSLFLIRALMNTWIWCWMMLKKCKKTLWFSLILLIYKIDVSQSTNTKNN